MGDFVPPLGLSSHQTLFSTFRLWQPKLFGAWDEGRNSLDGYFRTHDYFVRGTRGLGVASLVTSPILQGTETQASAVLLGVSQEEARGALKDVTQVKNDSYGPPAGGVTLCHLNPF